MQMLEVIERINEFDEEQTIYVSDVEIIDREIEAIVDFEGDDGEPPASAQGMRYLLEVSIAKDVIRVWSEWRPGATPSVDQMIEAVLYYAKNDAFIPVE